MYKVSQISLSFIFSKSISTYGIMIIAFYHQTKTPIGFWCRRELNPRSLIQLSETLLVKLVGTHIPLIILRVMLYLQTFLQHFYNLFWQQIFIGLHIGPSLTSFFYLLLITSVFYKKVYNSSIFLILVIIKKIYRSRI